MRRFDGTEPVPAVVTLHLWGVRAPAVPLALGRMALDRWLLRRQPAAFTRLLGTGHGRTFGLGDADPGHWAVLATWDDPGDTEAFERSATVRGWDRLSHERLVVRLRPLASRGRWGGRQPFGAPEPMPVDGPVASITRARIRARKARTFYRAVPPVAADVLTARGRRLAIGIGEAPVGLQGTFSLWDDVRGLTEFAHRRRPHREAIRQTALEDWYAEELFARFTVLAVEGTYAGRTP